ncbi:MAG: hypothetical protein K2K21_15830 [Lachnospiraceae bacterium]|nr:hypothetical protein [Lachnospiraceae bacterium]
MGAILVIGILLFAFCKQVVDEEATVDGITYIGYRAVQVNRRITEEFKGVLTDEKVEKIIEKYDLPYYYAFDSGEISFYENFLNGFINDYLSDKYVQNWYSDYGDYGAEKNIYPIADSKLGTVREITGKEIILEYYEGWHTFFEIIHIGMISGSILILFSVSVIFVNERQTNMLQLIFTTKEGREKEVYAKIAAAMTVAVSVWAVILILDLLLCGIVYGLDGLGCYKGMVTGYFSMKQYSMIPLRSYIMKAIMLSFFGIVSLCAITICVSVNARNNLNAFTVALMCYVAPVAVSLIIDNEDGVVKILCFAPIYMVVHSVIDYIYNIWMLILVISILISIICAFRAYRKYSRQQVA